MDKTILTIIGLTVVVLASAILFSAKNAPATPTAAVDDPNRPIAVVSESQFDFGEIAMADEPTRQISIRNDGLSPLQLSNVSTSCDCTYATITMPDGAITPEYNMHSQSSWRGELKSGETATVTIIYRPAVMPVTGQVSRAVSIKTNDPNQPSVQIAFTAEVQ